MKTRSLLLAIIVAWSPAQIHGQTSNQKIAQKTIAAATTTVKSNILSNKSKKIIAVIAGSVAGLLLISVYGYKRYKDGINKKYREPLLTHEYSNDDNSMGLGSEYNYETPGDLDGYVLLEGNNDSTETDFQNRNLKIVLTGNHSKNIPAQIKGLIDLGANPNELINQENGEPICLILLAIKNKLSLKGMEKLTKNSVIPAEIIAQATALKAPEDVLELLKSKQVTAMGYMVIPYESNSQQENLAKNNQRMSDADGYAQLLGQQNGHSDELVVTFDEET